MKIITPLSIQELPRNPSWDINTQSPGVTPSGDEPDLGPVDEPPTLYRQQQPSAGKADLTPELAGPDPVRHYKTQSGVALALAHGAKRVAYQAVLPAGGGLLPVSVAITRVAEDGQDTLLEAHTVEREPIDLTVRNNPDGRLHVLLGPASLTFDSSSLDYGLESGLPPSYKHESHDDSIIGDHVSRDTFTEPLSVVVHSDGRRTIHAENRKVYVDVNYAGRPDVAEGYYSIEESAPGEGEAVYHFKPGERPAEDTPLTTSSIPGGYLLAPTSGGFTRALECLGLRQPPAPTVQIQGFERFPDHQLFSRLEHDSP